MGKIQTKGDRAWRVRGHVAGTIYSILPDSPHKWLKVSISSLQAPLIFIFWLLDLFDHMYDLDTPS